MEEDVQPAYNISMSLKKLGDNTFVGERNQRLANQMKEGLVATAFPIQMASHRYSEILQKLPTITGDQAKVLGHYRRTAPGTLTDDFDQFIGLRVK